MSAETALIGAIAEKIAAPLALAVAGAAVKIWRDVHNLRERIRTGETDTATLREEMQAEIAAVLAQVAAVTTAHTDVRLSVVSIEGRLASIEKSHTEILHRFDRVDDKIDNLLRLVAGARAP